MSATGVPSSHPGSDLHHIKPCPPPERNGIPGGVRLANAGQSRLSFRVPIGNDGFLAGRLRAVRTVVEPRAASAVFRAGRLPLRPAHRSRRPGRKGVQVARERGGSAGCDQAIRGLRRRMARPRIRRAERRSPERVRCGVHDALVFRTVNGAIPAASSRCPESACCVRSDRGATEGGPPRRMAGRDRLGARQPSCGTRVPETGADAPDVRHNGT